MNLQSVLARGLHALLPPIEVIKGSYCNANPENPREWEVSRVFRLHSDNRWPVSILLNPQVSYGWRKCSTSLGS